ncbi:MAG TPA: hypothetical protein DCS93_21120 [Microscillaceae bacterium]|nr:hypothetical protein [Microscillaceae bacterium]
MYQQIRVKVSIVFKLLLFLATTTYSQPSKKNYFPLWTYHDNYVNIHGISLGIGSSQEDDRKANTNGLKVELIGLGIILPLIPQSPIPKDEYAFSRLTRQPFSEKINGISASLSGTVCHCRTNGITVGGIGQINFKVNGISASLLMNYVQISNGVGVALWNESYRMNGIQLGLANYGAKTRGIQLGIINRSKDMIGLQVGLFNKSSRYKGIQIGLWNENAKRSLPFINWSF